MEHTKKRECIVEISKLLADAQMSLEDALEVLTFTTIHASRQTKSKVAQKQLLTQQIEWLQCCIRHEIEPHLRVDKIIFRALNKYDFIPHSTEEELKEL